MCPINGILALINGGSRASCGFMMVLPNTSIAMRMAAKVTVEEENGMDAYLPWSRESVFSVVRDVEGSGADIFKE